MSAESKSRTLYKDLDTSFVNLWNLLRHLSQRSFVGRVHVEMEDYEADVFLTGSNTPLVHEIDRAAGTDVLEEAAMHRLVLRAREGPGTISVFEGADEAVSVTNPREVSATPAQVPAIEASADIDSAGIASQSHEPETDAGIAVQPDPEASSGDWNELVRTGGELIGAVERGLNGAGAAFAELFRTSRIELADDYPFLDPVSGFHYADSVLSASEQTTPAVLVTGISEALRRTIDKAARGDRARRTRERVALDLSIVARKRKDALQRSGFASQLDRIAGTKVI